MRGDFGYLGLALFYLNEYNYTSFQNQNIPENAKKPANSKRTSNKTGGKKIVTKHSA